MQTRSMVISLIGRPNVGKSSLYNRLMRKGHKAITHDLPGVTRDRHYGIAELDESSKLDPIQVILVDTGGFYPEKVEVLPGRSEAAFNSQFFNIMTDQAYAAIDESDLVLFIVDIREGALPFDQQIADKLRQSQKPFWLVVNKYDTEKQLGDEADFYRLGMEETQFFLTSAEHGVGLAELREALQERARDFTLEQIRLGSEAKAALHRGVTPREDVVARLALIGAPNVGKSTLLNLLVGANRALVSDIPGTTVDPIEGFFDLFFGEQSLLLEQKAEEPFHDGLLLKHYEDFKRNNPDVYRALLETYSEEEEEELEDDDFDGGFIDESSDVQERLVDQAFNEEQDEEVGAVPEQVGSFWRSVHLVDTAGIRRQKSIEGFIENQSVYRSLRCITESDIVLFLVDATKGIGHQDRRLMDIALEKGKSLILVMNKIDQVQEQLKTTKDRAEWIKNLRDEVPWLDFVDIVPLSAKYNRGVSQLKKTLVKTILVRHRKVSTAALNRFILDLIERHPVAGGGPGGKRFKVKYSSQIKKDPPTFLLFTNRSKAIPESYRRYLKNGLRRVFGFDNTPIHLIFRTSHDLKARLKKIGSQNNLA